MIEFRIWLPPINLWSKPWQHEFDRLPGRRPMRHDALKIYWWRAGKPQLYFQYGDDPWLPVQGEPSFNPAFDYSFRHEGNEFFSPYVEDETKPGTESYDYKRGYQQALEDMKAEVERLGDN